MVTGDDFPSSFDPAIHLHSERSCYQHHPDLSADLLELNQHNWDVKTQKTRAGIVIQHRAWRLAEAFRSEEDYPIDTPIKVATALSSREAPNLPSSPPIAAMDQASSPLLYPSIAPSSREALSPNKRRKLGEGRAALKEIQVNRRRGGFIEDDSDEEIEEAILLKHKVPAVSVQAECLSAVSQELGAQANIIQVPSLFDKPSESPAGQPDSAYASDTPGSRELEENEDASHEHSVTSTRTLLRVLTASGKGYYIGERKKRGGVSYESTIAARSKHVAGHAKRSYYGIEIHQLLDEAPQAAVIARFTNESSSEVKQSVEIDSADGGKTRRTLMWTEKYRARKFTDLVGDERTHRSVLRWLKSWDDIVFPGASNGKQLLSKKRTEEPEERSRRKILLLTGPPGLGKTTLAHVCAKQAGYEVQEINASDERSKDVVKGRIRDMVGTENVRGHNVQTNDGTTRKAGRPVCVVVDEVDGVVGGSGGSGEGGFIKALIDLVALDERNSKASTTQASQSGQKRKKKGDKFRMLRPLILICNDVYHPSLRPLRQGSIAEIIHMRKPNINMVISRVHSIFEKEGILSEVEGVRRLCEATWGVSTKKEGGTGSGTVEGDIRSVMVVGEWVATKLRATATPADIALPKLTRKWIEGNILGDLSHGGGAARSLGRGGAKEVSDRVFQEGAGFPKTNPLTNSAAQTALEEQGVVGVTEAAKRTTMQRLHEMVNASGDIDRIITDCFTNYPSQPIQDDNFLTKPNAAYDWLYFQDMLSSHVTSSQDWELAPYLSSPILAFHHLFASSQAVRLGFSGNQKRREEENDDADRTPFSGPAASFLAHETLKANTASLTSLHGSLSVPLARMYRSHADIATELLPYTLRMLAPDIKPVVINTAGAAGAKSAPTASVRKASEKALVARSVECMAATGVRFEKSRVDNESAFNKSASGGWVYRMEPPLDALGSYETMQGAEKGVRYAIRQVLENEWRKQEVRKGEETRQKKMAGEEVEVGAKTNIADLKKTAVKKDFFGRALKEVPSERPESSGNDAVAPSGTDIQKDGGRVWVSFHEGFSNAVRKPVTWNDLMAGL